MRVTGMKGNPVMPKNLMVKSSEELAKFIQVSPDQHRKIANLICTISDRMGKEGLALLRDFVTSVAEGKVVEFNKRWARSRVPMSVLSDLLALSQEMEADTREKLDALILKTKKGAIQLVTEVLQKALVLLV